MCVILQVLSFGMSGCTFKDTLCMANMHDLLLCVARSLLTLDRCDILDFPLHCWRHSQLAFTISHPFFLWDPLNCFKNRCSGTEAGQDMGSNWSTTDL